MLAVVTIAAGRHDHLRGQLRGLGAGTRRPDRHIVVSMADPQLAAVCADAALVIDQPLVHDRLPLAAARNRGAAHAIRAGADVLVFLDVDCIPAPTLVARYAAAARRWPRALLSGPVAYLPPASDRYRLNDLDRLGRVHPGRPAVNDQSTAPVDHNLFWSLSFAVTASCWTEVGGFCERYTGYGAEDTDFAQLARIRGIEHRAIGGAWAYHQWHPSPDPPVQHVADIVRNANLYHDRWGSWPMTNWLGAFNHLGLAAYDPCKNEWTTTRQINGQDGLAVTG